MAGSQEAGVGQGVGVGQDVGVGQGVAVGVELGVGLGMNGVGSGGNKIGVGVAGKVGVEVGSAWALTWLFSSRSDRLQAVSKPARPRVVNRLVVWAYAWKLNGFIFWRLRLCFVVIVEHQ